ncbi:MAG: glycosyltransferase [Bacteroidetes bacterium]|nr:MAG: glycosyltransferase [Bacteroidota bacterium]
MKRILIAPLDWGLGHATRCIPIIRYLVEKGMEVVIGADGRSMQLLQKEFPPLEFVVMPGYNISYPKSGSMVMKIAAQVPKILAGIKREHELLKKIIKEKKIDAVISDNRFGLWSREVPCVFITHQLMVKFLPLSDGFRFASTFGEKWIHRLNKKYISKYTDCWVPDTHRRGLSGDLAHKFPLPGNAKFIGVLSRFNSPLSPPSKEKVTAKDNLLIILSGPEPQRTVLEKVILEQLAANPPVSQGETTPFTRGMLIVQGVTEKNERRKITRNVEMVSYLTSEELQKEVLASEIVLSRPGYSTVMELAVLGKKAIFVPTPGQTEQEYLAKHFMKKKIAYSISQKEFDLQVALKESEKYSGFAGNYSGHEFRRAVDEFILSLT